MVGNQYWSKGIAVRFYRDRGWAAEAVRPCSPGVADAGVRWAGVLLEACSADRLQPAASNAPNTTAVARPEKRVSKGLRTDMNHLRTDDSRHM